MKKKLLAVTSIGTLAVLLFGTYEAEAYTVKEGETIESISKKKKVKVEKISKLNPHITDLNLIFSGEEIALNEKEVKKIKKTERPKVLEFSYKPIEIDGIKKEVSNSQTEKEVAVQQPVTQAPKEVIQPTINTPQPQPQPQLKKEVKVQPVQVTPQSSSGMDWNKLAQCESGGNPSINTGNGFYGLYQFDLQTWQGVGGSGYPHQASASEQTKRAQILYNQRGSNPWPSCGK